MDRFKRTSAKSKNIKDINADEDIRARVLGTVIEKKEDSIILDDGTKSVEVFVDNQNLVSINVKDLLRIYGRILPSPEGFEIQAEFIQNMNNLNLEVYSKIKEKFNVTL